MHAKQYSIPLPADYDMEIIRKRVADKGHFLDDRAGLGLKAYLIRERGVDGSPVNEYAPFYLWNDIGEMARFLVGGGGFQNIVRDFGRPAVLHWAGIACHAGPARNSAPKSASRRLTQFSADADVQQEVDELRDLAQHEDVHTAALALDPHHWQLLRFVLWKQAPQELRAEHYQVLHLSGPGLGIVPEGRAW